MALKSVLTTIATAAQTVAANGLLEFPTDAVSGGASITKKNNTTVALGYGLYLVTVNADLTPTAAGDISLQLLNNSDKIQAAEATVTGATGDTYNVGFTTLVVVRRSCCAVNNIANLQVQATAAGTISNAAMTIVRLA